jgi:pilus assembly protein CpaB
VAKERASPTLRPESDGERLVEVTVAGASALGDTLQPGARVDVLITSERGAGLPRTYVALQRVELVGFRAGSESLGNGGSHSADGVAALRVTLRQAVLLTAAQNFARELRLVARPPGDESRVAETAVTAEQLRP